MQIWKKNLTLKHRIAINE